MYTKNQLVQFADWMEENLKIDDDEKHNIAAGVLYSSPKPNIDFENLSIGNIIALFRLKINRVRFDNLGICKKEEEVMIFSGLERYRRIYEITLKSARTSKKEERVSGWW